MSDIIRISNISDYKQEIINNELILTPIYSYITENELYSKDLNNSIIENCLILDNDEIISDSIKYFRILIDIYKSMAASTILQNTKFNIKLTNENGFKGYTWCPEINMSVQRQDAIGTIKEIIKMIKINKYKINICIKLITNEKIKFKLD
jgi:hypothetical protein